MRSARTSRRPSRSRCSGSTASCPGSRPGRDLGSSMTATRPRVPGAGHGAGDETSQRRSGQPVSNGGRGRLRAATGACCFTIAQQALCRRFSPQRDRRARHTDCHGKEGVDGSSPSEGSPLNAALLRGVQVGAFWKVVTPPSWGGSWGADRRGCAGVGRAERLRAGPLGDGNSRPQQGSGRLRQASPVNPQVCHAGGRGFESVAPAPVVDRNASHVQDFRAAPV